MALSDLNCGLVVNGRGAHTLLDLSCHCEEGLFNVGSILSGGFQEGNANAVREFLANVSWSCASKTTHANLSDSVLHGSLICHIALVANQELVDAFCGVSINLL